jgi:hypothetical protein
MDCKNIECENKVIDNRKYCSLKCRNVYVNKYLRNYNKLATTLKVKGNKRKEEYNHNPKKCKNCDSIITFEKRRNEYCGHSCHATKSNSEREFNWGDKISSGIREYLVSNGKPYKAEYTLSCKYCSNVFINKRKEIKYCSIECRKSKRRENMNELQKYKQNASFKFNLKTYSDEFDFTLIEKYGWYSPSNKSNNLDGVSRDHMISIVEGFEMGVDPSIIAHPANCRLMRHSENIGKNKTSSITLDELLERIKMFNEKYN